ncbi:MAG: hypothetical protein ACRD0Q_11185 [Acidimicrobiales bacterium]
MTLVLLVLAVIWAVVLIPPALRNRAEGRPGDSISAFHRQLAVLRRTGPTARRLAATGLDGRSRSPMSRPAVSRPAAAASRGGGIAPLGLVGGPVGPHVRPSSSRSRTLQRRREVLGALAVGVAATLVLGALPFLRFLWAFNLVADLLLAAYIGLLIHQRNASAEREMKVRFLPHAVPLDPMIHVEPAFLQRSAN